MTRSPYDLVVIGGGSGGVRAARMAAQTGAKVALAEESRVGGTCVIRGCVPKKLYVYASGFSESFHDAEGFGWSLPAAPVFDWSRLVAAKTREIARLEGVYGANLAAAGVETIPQRATVADPHGVRLADGSLLETRHILIATGARPTRPPVPGAEHCLISDDVFDLPEFPKRLLVLGAGYIAVEFAGVFNGLGAEVTLAHRGPNLLRTFDADLQSHLAEEMVKKGVTLRLDAELERIEKTPSGLRAHFAGGEVLEADAILAAIGRAPNTAGLGLEAAGVELNARGAVQVDEYFQTRIPSIFAVGDVIGGVALTPLAIRQGAAFARTVFEGVRTRVELAALPTAVFSQPEIGTVGLTEEQARARGEVEIYRAKFRAMFHTLGGRDERTLMKLVVSKPDRKVLGAHVCGHGAAEMIQTLAVAVGMGARKEDLDRVLAVHPSSAEELVLMSKPVA
ncbi:glutathione-disulfide reductase [Neomegalonema sp.]|uniref:glutathione-disulfide reductase n=1 Tax=Neomegalonema sp. TaxID=2039713 RepID=UPI00261551FA|nr:glutathione-disulfide reductase [Neomegalonema sp.]MDD2869136.1 glutathione-disulfide reductase [Neomegalonema sp.]